GADADLAEERTVPIVAIVPEDAPLPGGGVPAGEQGIVALHQQPGAVGVEPQLTVAARAAEQLPLRGGESPDDEFLPTAMPGIAVRGYQELSVGGKGQGVTIVLKGPVLHCPAGGQVPQRDEPMAAHRQGAAVGGEGQAKNRLPRSFED